MSNIIKNIRGVYDVLIAVIFSPLFLLSYTIGHLWGIAGGFFLIGRRGIREFQNAKKKN